MTSRTVFFIFLVAVSGLSFGEECASGWTPYGDKCYRFSTDELSWKEALESCENEMSTLASVADSNINNNLWRNDGKMYWIGLQTTDNEDKWYWNDGMEFDSGSFLQWVINEPNSGDVCARLKKDYRIAGRECSYSRFYFICQAESNPGSWIQTGQYWFYFSREEGHFYNASKYCSDMGGYLARTAVFDALGSDKYDSKREYWIGVSRWYWTDGSQYVWHNFVSYEDKVDGPGICYVLHGTENKWEQRTCTEATLYICQKEKGTTSSTSPTTTTPKTTTSVLPTNSTTTKPAPSTSTTSTSTATTTPPEITPPPETRTTTTDKSIEPSVSTMEFVADNDSVSDVAVYTTGNGQTTVVVSSGEANELFDGDSGVIAGAVIGSMIVLTLASVIIVLLVRSRRTGCNKTPSKVTEPQTDYENVGAHSYGNVSTNTEDIIQQENTNIAAYINVECPLDYKEDNSVNTNAIARTQTAKEYPNTNAERLNRHAERNDDYEVVSNPYEQLQDRQDRTEPILNDYQSLTLSL